MYTAPIVLLLLLFLVLWILIQARSKLTNVVAFVLVTIVLIAPWTYRNYLVFDKFIPFATSSGYNLLAGNAPNARFDTTLNVRFPEYVYTELTGVTDEAEANSIMTRAAFEEIVNNPAKTARLYVGKFLHWFDYSNVLQSDTVVEGGATAMSVSTRDLILLPTYLGVIMLPLLAHVMMSRKYPFSRTEILFVALWICAGLAYALFFTRVRYRLPFDWLIISSNAIFLTAVFENWLSKQGRPVP